MRPLPLAASLAAAVPLAAQHSIVFTGRFPSVSLDAPNERPGGSITRIEEWDLAIVTPGPGAFARSWLPATAHQAFLGNPQANGNYTFFHNFKTYFQRIDFAGPFVEHADRASGDPMKIFWTVRDAEVALQIDVFTTGGTAVHTLRPGDFVRWTGNGSVEFFVTQDQIMAAAGPQTGTFAAGASAICQDAQGNLYYSPAEGGHHVSGNNLLRGPVFANDGSIVMIDAASITYDARGNVASLAAGSAHILWEELDVGPLTGPSQRNMVTNANHQTTNGAPAAFANLVGLDLDPGGGTAQAAFPVGEPPNHVVYTVPHFVFGSDNGNYGGTIFSTRNGGSVATINGVLCGSNTTGAPATGAHLGVALDVANFQPTFMGFCIVGALPYEPLVLDMPASGALPNAAAQATWDVDAHGQNGMVIFLLAQVGPSAPGQFPLSVPLSLLPPLFTADSFRRAFVAAAPVSLGFRIGDANGYATFSYGNPHAGPFAGMTLALQAAGLAGAAFQVSNPVLMQLK
jgi:hypothetical protein